MSFIKQQQQIAEDYYQGVTNKARARIVAKETITNTINHLMAEVKDRVVSVYDSVEDLSFKKGQNQANAKIRQRGADIISEVSE